MATTMTHRATPTATVTSLWAARTSAVDINSVDFRFTASLRLDFAISVLHTQAEQQTQSQINATYAKRLAGTEQR